MQWLSGRVFSYIVKLCHGTVRTLESRTYKHLFYIHDSHIYYILFFADVRFALVFRIELFIGN